MKANMIATKEFKNNLVFEYISFNGDEKIFFAITKVQV
jgi:hypothetical protein